MKAENYKECHRLSFKDNEFVQYYQERYVEGLTTAQEDSRHESLGYKYTDDENWYYQYDRHEQYYYVVVDK